MESKILNLTEKQALVHLINANKTYILWGRGTGKSTGALGPRTIHLANVMPGAQIGIIAPTYEMAIKNILPNIIGYWKNKCNLKEGRDYVQFKKPPEDFADPIIPVFDYKYVISFKSGTVFCIISLAVDGSANGFSLQALIGDEAKFFDEKRLKEQVFPTLRGCYHEFGHLPEYRSQFYATDKLGGNIRWLLNKKLLHNQKLIDIVISCQLEANRMQNCITDNSSRSTKYAYEALQKKIDYLRKNIVYFSEASAKDNIQNLTPSFFSDLKNELSEYQYRISVDNEDPLTVEECFYPNLTNENLYYDNNDVNNTLPFIVAFDYQYRISPMVIAQLYNRDNEMAINVVNSMFALYPKGLKDVISDFSIKYKDKVNRLIYYIFDHTAVERKSGVDRHSEIVIKELKKHNWIVVECHIGNAEYHDVKYLNINSWLKGVDSKGLIRINQFTNIKLLLSIYQSEAIMVSDKTKKNKKSEKDKNFPAEESTHFSDTFDTLLIGINSFDLVPINNYQNSTITFH